MIVIDNQTGHEDDGHIEIPPVVAVQERRMQVRAQNFWLSLQGNTGEIPSLSVLDANKERAAEFDRHSILLGVANTTEALDELTPLYLGDAIRHICDLDGDTASIAQASEDSLLAHVVQACGSALRSSSPTPFEAEFVNQRGAEILSRGLIMPLSGAGGGTEYLYAVVNWKEVAGDHLLAGLDAQIRAELAKAGI